MDCFDARQIVAGQRKAMLGDEPVADGRERFCGESLVGLDGRKRREDLRGRRVRREPGRTFARQQARHEVGAIGGELEQGFVHQVQIDVAAADVQNERHLRTQRGDVREVLFWSDAEIHTARPDGPHQLREDPLESNLVRHEVVRSEIAVRLGQIGHEFPERLIAEPRRQSVASREASG